MWESTSGVSGHLNIISVLQRSAHFHPPNMFSRAAVRVARPAIARVVAKPTVSRCISTTLPKFSDANPPKLFGPGGKAGEIASIYDQATGLERLQLLGDIEGVPVFDDSPLDSSRTGTKKDPIVVPSLVGFFLGGGYLSYSNDFLPGRRTPHWLHWLPSRLSRNPLVRSGQG